MSPQGKPAHRTHVCVAFPMLLAAIIWLAFVPVAVTAAPADRVAMLDNRPVRAQATITPLQGAPGELWLSKLNFTDQQLSGSGDEAHVNFGLPASWRLAPGAALRMHFAATVIGWDTTSDHSTTIGRVALRVLLNGQKIGLIPIAQSTEQTLTLPIPNGLLKTVASGDRNGLVFALEARLNCDELSPVEIMIYADSALLLDHTVGPLQPDLSRYPYPLIQNSIVTDTVTLVVPQQPSTTELAAAFAAAASLRQITNDGDLRLVREGDLSVERRDSSHLVLIGRPSRLPLLKDVVLAEPPQSDAFPSMEARPGDGVTQIAISPWGQEYAVLLLSGATDAAVLKAAQGLETLRRWPQRAGEVAVVAEIRNTPPPTIASGRQTFAQLGLYPETLHGLGDRVAEYQFLLPVDQPLPGNATFGLSFAHSALVNDARSQIKVQLNGQAVGGIRLTSDTAVGNVVQVALPRTQLQHGMNRLAINVAMRSIPGCGTSGQNDIWLTVRDDSFLQLTPTAAEAASALPFTLDRFPAPFADHPDLAELCVVVPPDDPAAWTAAMRVVIELAGTTDGSLVAPAVAFVDALPEAIRDGHHLLVVGQPRELSLLHDLDEALPVVFAPRSNTPDDRRSRVVMNFDPPAAQGYIELIAAPWDVRRAVLLVLGRDEQELSWAASGLTRSSLRGQLGSQLALIQQDVVVVPQLIAPPASLAASPAAGESSGGAASRPIATAAARPTPVPQPAPVVQPAAQVGTPQRSTDTPLGRYGAWLALGLILSLGVGGLIGWLNWQQGRGLY
jgi:Bacterial cellulose synthase subunit